MKQNIYGSTLRILTSLTAGKTIDRAALASLRTASSINSRQATQVWPIIFAHLQRQALSKTGVPTAAEQAIFVALKAFAMYQQGQATVMFAPAQSATAPTATGVQFFVALQQIAAQTSLDQRVTALLASTNFASVTNQLLHLVSLLKAKGTGRKIDFAALAADLYYYQLGNRAARQIALKWGSQYFYVVQNSVTADEKKESK